MAGIADIENSCTTGACKDYDYNNTDNVFACFTSSPDYETGYCSGAVDPCNAANTFYAVNNAAADKFNSYTAGSGLFIDNPNNCHCLPTVTVNHQCWDHVSQVTSTTTPVADFIGNPTTIGQGQTVTYTESSVEGGAAITAWDWVFENGTPSTYSGSTPPAVVYNTTGTHNVSLTVTNSFGSDTKVNDNYITVLTNGDIFSLDFETPSNYSQFFPPWYNIDEDGLNTYSSSDFDYSGEGSAFGFMTMNPADATVASPIALAHGGDKCGMAVGPSDASAANNWLISDRVSISNSSEFKLWVLTPKPGDWGNESFNILVSTTDNELSSFSAIATNEDAPSTWAEKTYSLSAYNGQDIYVAIQHVSANKFMFWVDDIEITGATVNNSIVENRSINIYPNPAKENITFANVENSNIEISDINGRVVLTKHANSNNVTLNIASLSKGTYIARIISDKYVTIRKIIVE